MNEKITDSTISTSIAKISEYILKANGIANSIVLKIDKKPSERKVRESEDTSTLFSALLENAKDMRFLIETLEIINGRL